jgi:anaerobic carbon-monoxide dehydrogenase iron sulfur subunit
MKIKVEKEKCSGCHLCEMVCSLFHLGALNVEKSAIRVERDDLGTSLNTPVVCRQCKKMKCLSKEEVDEAAERKKFLWNESRVKACPLKALSAFEERAYHCDLCGGDPQCTKVCTPGAITLVK